MSKVKEFFNTLTDCEKQEIASISWEWRKSESIKEAQNIRLSTREKFLTDHGMAVVATKQIKDRLKCSLLTAHEAVQMYKRGKENL